MMTFKEYLHESTIMSNDALKLAMSDYDKRRMGKPDGSKPKTKRLDQMDNRRRRKSGYAENEESSAPARRDRVQGIANTPNEIGRRPSPEREFQRVKRRVRRTRGIGSSSKGAMPIDDL